MAAPIKAPLPLGLDLGDAYTIRIAALDPTTGADVAGVVISDVSIMVEQVAGPPIEQFGVGQLLVRQADSPGTNA